MTDDHRGPGTGKLWNSDLYSEQGVGGEDRTANDHGREVGVRKFSHFNSKRFTVLTVLTTCSRFVPFWNAITGQL